MISDYHGVSMLTHGRNVSYDLSDPNLPQATQWLISNPNRINLGRIGLKYRNATLTAAQVMNPRQELDVWNGTITSTFILDGETVKVITQGDFESDAVAFQVESSLVSSGALQVELDFPYPPIHSTTYKYEVSVGSYNFPLNHTTTLIDNREERGVTHIHHEMQTTEYFANIRWPTASTWKLSRNEPNGSRAITAHRYTLAPVINGNSTPTFTFTAQFSPEKRTPALPATIQTRNTLGWNRYWNEGGFVDLTFSTNVNATELQRRIILSQYHVRVNSAADGQSPQESGLMNNGWYGKFHMEVVLLHTAHW
jgi:hypothetical protein